MQILRMWTFEFDTVTGGMVGRLEFDSAPMSCAEVLARWQSDTPFVDFFSEQLASCPFEAFRWETPPMTRSLVDRPFEMALMDSPGLLVPPDPRPFEVHFDSAIDGVATFGNLGGDATLIVPSPVSPSPVYAHLASFLRGASQQQIRALWRRVGLATEERLGARPVWLSTAGAGVAWLHVRLDDRPKYYWHRPYCRS